MLSDIAIRKARPGAKPVKLYDGGGLFLLMNPSGSRWWRFKYRMNGKEKGLSFGTYPDVSLKAAREERDKARKLIKDGIDPSENRKAARVARGDAESFETIAREWYAKFSRNWVASHRSKIIRRLERDVFPWLGRRPIAYITAPELLTVARRIEARGAVDTAHRALANCSAVFRYGVATGRAERDPTADLRGALPPVKSEHYASITDPKAIGDLLRAIDGYQGSFVTRCALRLAPLVFVRPGELRRAEWQEFDLDAGEWRIDAARMKMRAVHIVPLSKQAVEILRELQPLTGNGHYVFPGARTADRPMSENTLNAALRRLGYASSEMTAHGFRSMASTLLNEQGWHRDAIERQLAHAEGNAVRAAYNYAEHLPERRKMMQSWADYIDRLVRGAEVVSIENARVAKPG